jgi:hypothetical protein
MLSTLVITLLYDYLSSSLIAVDLLLVWILLILLHQWFEMSMKTVDTTNFRLGIQFESDNTHMEGLN